MINVNLVGRLVAPAEVAVSQRTGKQYVKFTVASKGKSKDAPADFIHVMTGAVGLQPYLGKGAIVAINGSLSVSAYLGKQDNQPKASITIMAQQVELLSRGSDSNASASAPAPAQAPVPQYTPAPAPAQQAPQYTPAPAQAPQYTGSPVMSEDIPF